MATRKKCWSQTGGGNKKYLPEYCDLLQEVFAGGGCVARFCVRAGIGRQTFYEWCDANREFDDAYALAKELSKAHWMSFLLQYVVKDDGELQSYPLKVLLANSDIIDKRNVRVSLAKAKNCAERAHSAAEFAQSGEHTAEEIASVATTVRALNEISTLEKMEQRLDALDGQSNNT